MGRILVTIIIILTTLYLFTLNSQVLFQPVLHGSDATGDIGEQTKTTACHTEGPLQDFGCTPGAVVPNITKDQLCSASYEKTFKPVSQSMVKKVYQAYGLRYPQKPGQYQLDHLISVGVGGSNDVANLWPEAADPTPGYHEKDQVEQYLHDQVCSNTMSMQQVQLLLATNWLGVYNSMPDSYKQKSTPDGH